MIVVSHDRVAAQRWLAHLLRASEASIRRGDRFDDDANFDAERVAELAVRERVAPLLHRALRDDCIADALPAGFREACERVYYATLHKNLLALESGRELLDALGEMGVRAAPVKGWALLRGTAPLYPDPGTRPMDDLDFVVSERDRACAEAVLGDLGFERITRHAAALAGGHELAFHRRASGVDLFVELHWAWAGSESLMRPFAVPGERFLDGLCKRDSVGRWTPTRAGHLLFTAVHAARHTLGRWIWLVDLHRLVVGEPPDWPALLHAARVWRVRRPLYAALLATRRLLRTPVPREVIAALAPGPVRRRLLDRSLTASLREAQRPQAAWTAKLLLGESWWDVMRTAAWAARPGGDWYRARGLAPSTGRRLAHPLRALRATGPRG